MHVDIVRGNFAAIEGRGADILHILPRTSLSDSRAWNTGYVKDNMCCRKQEWMPPLVKAGNVAILMRCRL